MQVSGHLGFSGSSARVARSVPVNGYSISLVLEEAKTEKKTQMSCERCGKRKKKLCCFKSLTCWGYFFLLLLTAFQLNIS